MKDSVRRRSAIGLRTSGFFSLLGSHFDGDRVMLVFLGEGVDVLLTLVASFSLVVVDVSNVVELRRKKV